MRWLNLVALLRREQLSVPMVVGRTLEGVAVEEEAAVAEIEDVESWGTASYRPLNTVADND